MRSSGLAHEIEFAEAKSRNRRDALFATTCLRLLRRWAVAHPQAELVESLAQSLADLIFSSEPCAPAVGGARGDADLLATRLPWFELCGRVRDEKRQEALEKEALQLERQELVASIASLEEELNSDARAQELFLAGAQAREEQARAEHSRELAMMQQREAELVEGHSREAALLSRRLEYSDAALQRAREELAAADAARSRRTEAAHAASDKLARGVAAASPPRGTAEVAATLQAQLRALQLSTLSVPAADAGSVAAELHREAALLPRGRAAATREAGLPPAAARAVETQQVLAAYLAASLAASVEVEQPRTGVAQQRRISSTAVPPRTGQRHLSVPAPRRSVVM